MRSAAGASTATAAPARTEAPRVEPLVRALETLVARTRDLCGALDACGPVRDAEPARRARVAAAARRVRRETARVLAELEPLVPPQERRRAA